MLRFAFTTLVVACGLLLGGGAAGSAPSASVVISQVYGGGNNTGATYQNDFVELHNTGRAAADLTGWSVQYAPGGGTTWQVTSLPAVSLPAGAYFLVKESGGTSYGSPLPAADATGTTNIKVSNGKIALVADSAQISTTCPTDPVDEVGYGTNTVPCFEGAGPAPSPSATTADLRAGSGCTDTGDNSADFVTETPAPRNASSTLHYCNLPQVSSTSPADAASDVPLASDLSITFDEPVDVGASWVGISCADSGAHAASVTGGPTTFTLDPDASFAPGERCTVTVTASQVTVNDPPEQMAADYTFAFTAVRATHYIVTSSDYSPVAGATVTISAQLAGAGDAPLAAAGRTVNWSPDGAGSLSATGSVTNAAGIATVDLTTSTAAGTVSTVTATDSSDDTVAGMSGEISTVPGPATHLTFTSSSGPLAAGDTRELAVQIRDEHENVVTGDGSTSVTFSQTDGPGSVEGLGSATASAGTASLTVTGHSAGNVGIEASAAGLRGATSAFLVTAGPADHLAFTSVPATLASAASGLLTIELRDAEENVLTGDSSTSVAFTKTDGGGTVEGLGSATVSNGVATEEVTGRRAGSIVIVASAGGVTADSATFEVVPGPADHLSFTSAPSTLASAASGRLTVELRDAEENVLTGDSSTSVAFTKTDGGGTVEGLGPATVSNGVATEEVTGRRAGSIVIEAWADGVFAGSATFEVVPGPPDHLAFRTTMASLASGSSRMLDVEVRDVNENTVSADSGRSVDFQTSGSGTIAWPDGASPLTSNGVASKGVTARRAGPVVVSAHATGLDGDSIAFDVVPGAADHLTFTSSAANLPFATARTLMVDVRDANGNRVTTDAGRTITFAKSSGSGSVSGLGDASTSGGGASRPVTGSGGGAITISATATGLTAATSGFTVLAPDGSGTITTPTGRAVNGSGGNTIAFTYTAAPGGIADGAISLTVPSGWSAPSATATDPGFATASSGSLTINESTRTIVASGLTVPAGGTVRILYGSKTSGGPGAVAPTAGGVQTWTARSRASSGGTRARLAAAPAIDVLAPDGPRDADDADRLGPRRYARQHDHLHLRGRGRRHLRRHGQPDGADGVERSVDVRPRGRVHEGERGQPLDLGSQDHRLRAHALDRADVHDHVRLEGRRGDGGCGARHRSRRSDVGGGQQGERRRKTHQPRRLAQHHRLAVRRRPPAHAPAVGDLMASTI
jgi:hypothetical protein